ncbi:hypothetical protein BJF90_43720 [Pseudonocardia sp. CNS-004]|nr:hypothetical protein BJF90_43720 [Pseudonocardia sp. CNS-004]
MQHDRRVGRRQVGGLEQLPQLRGRHLDAAGVGGPLHVADLDLLVAHRDHELEEAPLALRVHGLDERLVAVPQVDRHP